MRIVQASAVEALTLTQSLFGMKRKECGLIRPLRLKIISVLHRHLLRSLHKKRVPDKFHWRGEQLTVKFDDKQERGLTGIIRQWTKCRKRIPAPSSLLFGEKIYAERENNPRTDWEEDCSDPNWVLLMAVKCKHGKSWLISSFLVIVLLADIQ